MTGCILDNNTSGDGGAVYVNRDAAAFSATNSLFTDNRSTAHAGGAITAYADTSLDGCTVSGNTAYTTGGGIWSSKSLTLENTVIENNTANGTSDSRGGAVCVISGTANMTDCTVGNNTSKDGGAVYVNDESTAVFNATNTVFIGNESTEHGGGAVTAFAEATFEGCTFTGNKAYKSGGGIWTDTTLTMTDCNVNNNIAENNCGGGIYARSVLNLTGCVVSSNTCAEWGGGIYLPDDTGSTLNMTNGRIENNTCGNNGGGVQVSGTAEMNISGYIVISNNKKAGEDNNLCLAEGKSVTVSGALDPETRIGVLKSNPAGNITSGLNDKGGADNFSSDDSNYTVAVDGSGEAYLSKTTADYTVNSWASLQSAVNGASYGAVIELSDDVINTNNKERIRVNGDKNITIDLKGKTIDRKRRDKDRDGHVFEVFGRLTVRDSVGGGKITGGFANNGGGVNVGDGGWFILAGGTINYNKGDNGGGVHVKDGGRLTVTGGTISRNEASEHGGGIYIASGGRVDLSNAAIKMNSAQNDGGGVYLHLGYNATFSNCQITENYSYDYGGGIYMDERGKTLTIKNNTIINNNFSDDDGGGIYLYRGTINMNGGSVSENSTRCDGGGVRVTGDTTFSAENVKIQNNTAQTEDGGGLKNHGTTTLKSCLITGNKSVEEGGGVYNDADSDSAGDLTIDSCVIAGNSTSGGDDKSNGGGVYNHEKLTIKGNTTIGACTVEGINYPGNHADKHGGGLYASKGKGSQDVKIQGKLLMEGNTAGLGYDLYLAGDKKLDLTGRIDNTRIGFVDMADPGVITVNYNKYHNVEDPANYFATGEGAIPISWTSDGKEARMHSNWNVLQRDINNAESGDTITFGQNYTASSDDDRLKIPKGKTLTIDLKGYTINRNRIKKDRDGHVIEVFGNLTVKDSSKDHSGKITGGFANNGGGVNVSEDNAVFTLEGGSICGNNADDGGVYVRGNGYFNMKGGSVSNNTASSQGGGIYVCSGGKLDMSDADVSGNTASNDGGGMYLKIDKDATFTNCTIKGNTSFDYGGGIYMDAGGKTLTINGKNTAIDNNNASDDGGGIHLRNGTINMTGGSVSGNITRYDSGGVKVSSSCTFTADGVTISNNTASNEEGSGIKNLGTTSLTDCTISGNKAKLNGGGIYNDASGDSAGKLTLNNCTITGNTASKNGGGVLANGDYFSVHGSPVVKNNKASKTGGDIYLPSGRTIDIDGILSDGARLGVSIAGDFGTFTNRYSYYNSAYPSRYFVSTQGYTVLLANREAELVTDTFGETDFESPFIGRKDQVNADPDTLSSVNWLSGVSGENYLNEINMPGSHDSSMNKLETVGNPATPSIPLALFFGGNILFPLSLFTLIYADYTSFVPFIAPTIGRKFAKTQIEYIDEQLQGGARQLDLRLNDRYKDGSSGGFHYNDDGENLWVCHGKSGGGTYFAENDNGKRLSLDMILTWCKDFLKNHPTETIILDLRPETEEKDHTNNIYLRARKILEKSLVDDENPTIDEPYLYKEPGSDDYFAPYTHMPQLKDCRGKIVIQPEDPQFMAKIGGYMLDSFSDQYDAYFEGLDFTQQAHEMVEQVKREYTGLNGSGSVKLPTDSDTRCNNLWYWELNCTGQNQGTPKNYTFWGEAPYVMAEDVNPEVAGDGKLFGPQKAGQYIGWVRFDSFEAQYAEAVWQTNFSDALQYCTVTVESGLDESIYPAQTFKVLKGTNITIPGNIYKNLSTGKNIGGWTAKGATVDTVCAVGDDFKISEDVTFTAKWLEKGQVPVRIEWKDGENADQLRGGSVKLNVNAEGGTKELTLSANGNWQGIVSVEGDVTGIVPDWNKIVITDENPLGQDIEGQYRYGSMYEAGNGFVLTFTHTPLTKTSVAGMIVWDDEGYENKRPSSVTVHLLKNGADTGTSATVTAENDWQFDFTDLAQYENGEEIKYSITEDDVVGYTAIIDGYTVTNSYVINDNDTLEAIGLIAWDDSDNAGGIRPESVTVHLMNNGEEVASKEVEAEELGIWSFNFGKIPINDIENYTLTVDEVDGYTATVDNSASPAFSVTYTLLVEESEKDPAELIEAPAALDLTYTGEAQTLIEEGKASGGWPVYALGTNDTTAPDAAEYNALLPAGTDVGTYYVWYYVKGDALHTDTEPQCLTASIKRKFFTGHSLTLEGDIGVNFFVNLTEEEVQNATVSFTWFDKTLNNVPLNTQLCDNGYYKVSCPVAVAEMTYEITATLKINGEEAATDTCSVVEYANKILSEDYEETYTGTGAKSYANLKALVQSMLDYGSRAQTRFDRNTENLANGGNYFFDNEVLIDSVASDMSADLENYGLRYEFTSVLFLSKTSLRHYYTVTDKDKFANFSGAVTINGVKAEPVEKYGKIYFEKTNIAASELDLQFALKIGNSTYNYSVIDYVKLFVDSDLEEASIELGKATYRYNQAAKAYFAD